ncbi:class I SAM-dependent methyltransferase [Pseudomonas promysalinigenes]|uniref:Class I SAM-dependent methyltransferase n=1 Tax=Pseudomonas promysalinigenes TaxID=485898 RepID=A0ABY6AI26_9PSED|nr:class I SAM-dependent methyltransferase [Pseudomonas promysalinigenes]UXH38647.1 class I SAM-dependent methyltransferase [Pseudomonas promysalinigenes]
MNDSRRIKGERVAIDYDATRAFFEARGKRDYANVLSATMYQDNDPELVERRDQAEKAAMASILGLNQARRIFDIGCGTGRWGWFLAEHCQELDYLGVDFSASLIDKAKAEAVKRQLPALQFQVMSATDIQPLALQVSAPFDLALISGLLIYLNDADCIKVLGDAARLLAQGGRIYLREPVGVADRFTLDRFYSEELADQYSAIYRTAAELRQLMDVAFDGLDMCVEHEGFLFSDSLEKRAETRQYFFVLRRSQGAAQ